MKQSKTTKIVTSILAAGMLFACPSVVNAASNSSKATAKTSIVKKTAKITYGTKLPKKSYMTVAYLPGHSIHIFKQNKNNHFAANGQKVKNGTTHTVYHRKKVGHSTYYYIGKKKWVNAKHLLEYHLKHTRYNSLKKNPKSRAYYTSQYNPVFAPWGCASSSLSMLMKYDHTFSKVPGKGTKAELTYMQSHLPMGSAAKGYQDASPYTGKGFTRVINSRRLMQYAHKLGDKKIVDVSGISLNNIKKLVLAGHPVLYYGYSSYNGTGARNHCKVIFGYSKKSNKFLVHDPLYMYHYFYKGGGGVRDLGIHNGYDLGPISWIKASHIQREFAYRGGNNALTTTR